MNDQTLLKLTGRSALVNGLFYIASSVTIFTFFAIGGFWGKLNDGISVVYAFSFIPLALFFYRLHEPLEAPLNRISTAVGLIAMTIFGVAQFLLTVNVVRFEQTIGLILLQGAVIGLWLLAQAWLARRAAALPAALIGLMIVYGTSFVISAPLWGTLGGEHPLTTITFLAGVVAGPIWAFWLGRLLLTDRLPIPHFS